MQSLVGGAMFSVCWEQHKNNTILFLASSLLLFVFMYLLNISVFRISLIFISCCPSCCFLFPSFPYFYFATSHPFSTPLISFIFCPLFTLLRLSSSRPLFLSLIIHSSFFLFRLPSFPLRSSLTTSLCTPFRHCYSPCCLSPFFFLLLPCSPTCWLAHSFIDSVDYVTSMPSGWSLFCQRAAGVRVECQFTSISLFGVNSRIVWQQEDSEGWWKLL